MWPRCGNPRRRIGQPPCRRPGRRLRWLGLRLKCRKSYKTLLGTFFTCTNCLVRAFCTVRGVSRNLRFATFPTFPFPSPETLPRSQFSATANQLLCSYFFAEVRADTPRPPLAGGRIGGGRGYGAVIGLTNLDSKNPDSPRTRTPKKLDSKLSLIHI